MKATFGFTGKNERAAKIAKKQAARFITELSKRSKEAIRTTIARSIKDGIAPRRAAKLIREFLGLDSRRAIAVMNYRERLEANDDLTAERVDSLVDRYAEKKLSERAEMVARYEVNDAVNEGFQEALLEAQEEGFLGAILS